MEKDSQFSDRLELRDKFSALARGVLGINKHNAYDYFALKLRMREDHNIDVYKPSIKRLRAKLIPKKSTKKNNGKRQDPNPATWWMRW